MRIRGRMRTLINPAEGGCMAAALETGEMRTLICNRQLSRGSRPGPHTRPISPQYCAQSLFHLQDGWSEDVHQASPQTLVESIILRGLLSRYLFLPSQRIEPNLLRVL